MARICFAAIVSIAFFYVASPLAIPIAMGAVLAVLFFPCLSLLEKKKVPVAVGSALLTFGITVVVLLPISSLVFFAAKGGLQQVQSWKQTQVAGGTDFLSTFLHLPKVHRFMTWTTSWIPFNS